VPEHRLGLGFGQDGAQSGGVSLLDGADATEMLDQALNCNNEFTFIFPADLNINIHGKSRTHSRMHEGSVSHKIKAARLAQTSYTNE